MRGRMSHEFSTIVSSSSDGVQEAHNRSCFRKFLTRVLNETIHSDLSTVRTVYVRSIKAKEHFWDIKAMPDAKKQHLGPRPSRQGRGEILLLRDCISCRIIFIRGSFSEQKTTGRSFAWRFARSSSSSCLVCNSKPIALISEIAIAFEPLVLNGSKASSLFPNLVPSKCGKISFRQRKRTT